ncbi:MAG: hypothetical protein V2I33_21390, partial [Kangiellaceae bacterium]|nr:hypothetical protein [Kangiellaceae bacterium]
MFVLAQAIIPIAYLMIWAELEYWVAGICAGGAVFALDLLLCIPFYLLREGQEITCGKAFHAFLLLALCSGNLAVSYYLTDYADEDFREDWVWASLMGEGVLLAAIHPLCLSVKY